MTDIFIINDIDKKIASESDFKTIYAKSKKDFFKQIKKMIKNNEITKNWGLANNYSLQHRWFAN